MHKDNLSNNDKFGLLEEDLEFNKKLKEYFIKTCSDKISEIYKSLDEGNITNAYRLAHTIKGNAAQLGKTHLQKAAAEVEGLLKNGKNDVTDAHLKNLEMELKAVIIEFNGSNDAG